MAINQNPDWKNIKEIGGYGQTGSIYRDASGKYYMGKKGLTGGELAEFTGPGANEYAENLYNQYLSQTQPKEVAASQEELAKSFRANVPTYTGLLKDQATKTIQRNLAEKMQGLKQASSNRGFLKGSGTQKEQAETLSGSQVEQMQKGFDIEDAIEKQAQQFENQALATKLSQQGSANQAYIDQLRQNILDSQRQSDLWKALGGAIGPGVGYYMAKKGT